MAGTLLHITIADAAIETGVVQAPFRDIVMKWRDDFHLGAVIVDLPYYEHFVRRGLLMALTGELGYDAMGQLLHLRNPSDFSRVLLDEAKSEADRVFALGSLTHLATDLVFHPVVEQRVLDTADGTRDLGRLHKCIEDALDILAHEHLVGHAGIGRPYAWRLLSLNPKSRWTEMFQIASKRLHGVSPTRRRLHRWLRALRMFGYLHCSSGFPWVATGSAPDDWTRRTARELTDAAVRLSTDYLQLGTEYLEKRIDAARFVDRVPNRNLVTGKEAEQPRPSWRG
jgi:hypothetical protein